ncbi:tetratricopeptide repeat protein [Parasedimentitalea maritima]|uniref:Tetratricopeptide repeat protein n=2 Tax=Parasedimentitalea maritima TaxID=2578117 RepID=A0ABY2UWA8_9RHOB|nr:tetratricopeptide repeat protein [Zongyanglinia marina]
MTRHFVSWGRTAPRDYSLPTIHLNYLNWPLSLVRSNRQRRFGYPMSIMQNIQLPNVSEIAPSGMERFAKIDELIAEREFPLALPMLLKMLQIDAKCVDTLNRAAICYFELGDAATALALLQFITENWPKKSIYWGKLAEMCQFTGDIDGAIANYKQAIKVDPNNVLAIFKLNHLEPFKRESKQVSRLRKLDKAGKLTQRGQALVSSTLGQIEAKNGRHRAAFRHFARSKSAKTGEFPLEDLNNQIDAQITDFQPSNGKPATEGEPRMIFVCGLPRSGTTLVENILSSHADVGSIGESFALSQTVTAIGKRLTPGQNRWQWLKSRTDEEISILREYFHRVALKGLPNEHGVIVDKMPLNCLDIGVAQMLLPDAKFIFMVRHPLDVGLSNFITNFQDGNAFSQKLSWIAQMTHEVYRSADDYSAKLAGAMRMQSFRALVENPEEQIRRMLEHTGLPWQDACMHPERGEAVVRTASSLQIRKGINSKGLGKWKTYEDQLQPLLTALGGEEWLSHWQTIDEAAASS